MKTTLGLLLIVAGIALGIYVGLWLMFVGGIVGIIEQIRAPQIDALAIALYVVRILLATPVGGISALALIVPGLAIARS